MRHTGKVAENVMKVSVATDRLTFTPLTDADLPVLHDWLGREHVSRWGGRSVVLKR